MRAPIGFKLCILASIILLGILLTADAWSAAIYVGTRDHAKETTEKVYDLGYAMHNGRRVRVAAGIQELDQ